MLVAMHFKLKHRIAEAQSVSNMTNFPNTDQEV